MSNLSPVGWFFYIITQLGSELFFILFLSFIYWVIDDRLGRRLLYILLPSVWLNSFLKDILQMPRPPPSQRLVSAEGYGFPSGHAQNSVSLWGYLSTQIRETWVTITCTILIILISISRIYLGVHYLHDVLGGLVIGTLLLIAYLKLEPRLAESLGKLKCIHKILISLLLPPIFILIPYYMFPHPISSSYLAAMGALSGASIGIILERKYLKFSVEGTLMRRVLRYPLGILILLIILLIIGKLGVILPILYTKYFILGLFISLLAPAMFQKLQL
ncbi:MAG TPA: phosphatase PAP2 family protein [Candidatus Bathyarchaeota archaeon]|nr:phosphatase PAP2 family protein [Candidatus Bathyarchaeota archaeon]